MLIRIKISHTTTTQAYNSSTQEFEDLPYEARASGGKGKVWMYSPFRVCCHYVCWFTGHREKVREKGRGRFELPGKRRWRPLTPSSSLL